jgi:hypothetical protein
MTVAERYQELVDAGLIIPATVTPPGFKFPTMLVQFPSITTSGTLDRTELDKILSAELDQDLVLSIHHCYMNSLMNTSAYKMIENHLGIAMVKNVQQQMIQPQLIRTP